MSELTHSSVESFLFCIGSAVPCSKELDSNVANVNFLGVAFRIESVNRFKKTTKIVSTHGDAALYRRGSLNWRSRLFFQGAGT